jgi:PhzF family phenazine biosynthesis protein
MSASYSVVDAFTHVPFGGNPAAVFVLAAPWTAERMHLVAREMQLSETAFVVRQDGDTLGLRWFTPTAEVDLCGHATLASAHTLWATGVLAPTQTARFATKSGILTATQANDWITMDLPARPVQPTEPPADLTAILGVALRGVWRNQWDLFVELPTAEDVRQLAPDLAAIRALDVQGVIVTSASDTPDYDFVSRYFVPALGIDEDPATGAAHTALAPFWAERLGKAELIGYQASARGGTLRVRPQGERVLVSGQAVTVARGELLG